MASSPGGWHQRPLFCCSLYFLCYCHYTNASSCLAEIVTTWPGIFPHSSFHEWGRVAPATSFSHQESKILTRSPLPHLLYIFDPNEPHSYFLSILQVTRENQVAMKGRLNQPLYHTEHNWAPAAFGERHACPRQLVCTHV